MMLCSAATFEIRPVMVVEHLGREPVGLDVLNHLQSAISRRTSRCPARA
jgi:hypothetical protein